MNNTNNNNPVTDRDFKKPVSWLMGRELLAGLKYIAAYSFMGDKLDAKDWMQASIEEAPAIDDVPDGTYWFDFIADTGDGMKAVYNVAYLCMSDLWLNQNATAEQAIGLEAGAASEKLPRGKFLFVGGDTAYHIADVASLKERFQTPFNWAFDDIGANKSNAVPPEQRPIYAIPANHDYYDALDGFNRQFRKPFGTTSGQIALKGFESRQQASYLTLKLPFGWQLWGFDSQNGKMDLRQTDFFQSCARQRATDKLIVVTPEPNTVFGKQQAPDAAIVTTFNDLGLPLSFLQDGELDGNQCRLDLAGDIHHYERYWGDEKRPNYASVVAGGGGAFLHPSHTDIGEVDKLATYPSHLDSHRTITQRILNPWAIATGGFVWLAGSVLALLSYFALTVPESTWSIFGQWLKPFPAANRPLGAVAPGDPNGILARIQIALTVDTPPDGAYLGDLAYILLYIGFLVAWILCLHNFGKSDQKSSIPLIAALQDRLRSFSRLAQRRLLVLSVLTASLPLLKLIFLQRVAIPNAFLASILIELFSIAALLLFVLNRKYSDLLNERAVDTPFNQFAKFYLYPLWIFGGILAPLFAGYGFLHYGVYPVSVMTFNLLIVLVWSLIVLGLPALGYFIGGALLTQNKKIFLGIGVWHMVLQVATPVWLTLYADWPALLIISALAVAATEYARRHFSADNISTDPKLPEQQTIGKRLFIAWGALGATVLIAAFLGTPMTVTLCRLLSAFVLGALFSCIWFGWYLAVSLAFNGHNNEAGGGARSENYRHMIRIALRQNSLTAYVIGIDKPYTDAEFKTGKPTFRLVDKFTIELPSKSTG
ncbi:hypothetical protein [Methylomicrobium lacus]|uniref:hypothetical protein n=1 Tax=Methylomicrobium lacus TaxID=136992 RepID=UPI0035A98D6D